MYTAKSKMNPSLSRQIDAKFAYVPASSSGGSWSASRTSRGCDIGRVLHPTHQVS